MQVPLSRDILQSLTDVDLQDAAFPYLGVREGLVAGVPARLLRVGFVGELGYEIHVPAGGAAAVWQALHGAGLPRGLRPFGVEAQRVLRLEKGHFIVGQDTDGLTDPFEANARWAVSMQKPFFVGQRSLKILQARGPRQRLVGIEILDPTRLPRECQLVIDGDRIAGRVTSVVRSRTLNKSIGLAMLAPQIADAGGDIRIRADQGEMLAARIAPTPFYDPENLRQRAGSGDDRAQVRCARPAHPPGVEGAARRGMAGRAGRRRADGAQQLGTLERRGGSEAVMVARLGQLEFFLEDAPAGTALRGMAPALAANPPGVYPVLREDCSVRIER